MSKNTRLAGHELVREGAPHNERGYQERSAYSGTGGSGYGKCSCGELSGLLHSGNARQKWHREHKNTIRGEKS